MKTAICPGSFDPITLGHLDIIERASKLFDKVIVLVVINPDKKPVFSAKKRADFIRRSTTHLKNVEVDLSNGLLADYLEKIGACAIVKGLRALSDFEYEFQMALANKVLSQKAETIFLTTKTENMYLSSSLVRQIGSLNGEIKSFVPEEIYEEVKEALKEEV